MTDSSEKQVAFFGSVGFVSTLIISYMAVFVIGLMLGLHWNKTPPLPPYPNPEPWPRPIPDSSVWYNPPQSALRELPRDPTDGCNRRGQNWRWEMNQRYEYRFRHLPGDPGSEPIGDMPKE